MIHYLFFVSNNLLYVTSVICLRLKVMLCVHLIKEVVNHESLWFLGKLTKFLAEEYPAVITAIWYPALAAHVGEAIYAFILARQKVIF